MNTFSAHVGWGSVWPVRTPVLRGALLALTLMACLPTLQAQHEVSIVVAGWKISAPAPPVTATPNPVSDALTLIERTDIEIDAFYIHDWRGTKVFSAEVDPQTTFVATLSPGIHYIYVVTNSGTEVLTISVQSP